MFLKPYKLKSNAPLKGSDSKRLRQRIDKSFFSLTPEQMQQLLPNKANVSLVKIVTHGDSTTNVFCVDKLPMFFEIEGEILVPTLYAMWQVPDLLPYFTTLPAVLPKLSNGADLMLPGVIAQGTGMNMYGRYKKGQLVAVNLTSNKSAVAVGFLPHSSDDLYMCGGYGSAVKMLHIFGDKLWTHEPGLVQQVPNNKPADLKNDDFPALGGKDREKDKKMQTEPSPPDNFSAQGIKDRGRCEKKPTEALPPVDFPALGAKDRGKHEKKATESNPPKTIADLVFASNGYVEHTQTVESKIQLLDVASIEINDEVNQLDNNEKVPIVEQTPPDAILKNAFLAALKNHGKTLQLPLLTSNFYRLYVVPEAQQQIDLKKTKYKKLSNFLNEMIDQGFIVVREETKGVDKITSIDLEHPELVNFITDFKKPVATDVNGQEQQPLFYSQLTELYIVTDETAAFFTKMNYKRAEGIPSVQIKKIVREYISKNNLLICDSITKSFRLDECLASICEYPAAPLSKICNTLISKMSHSYQMCSVKDISPNKPLIQMSLATRSGNKKVTLVSNVECYGIIVPEFIKLCKQGAAASTTVVRLPNQKRELLQIQGNQVRFIYNLLTETYKVPGKFILGLELAKDGKKQKKK